MVLYLAKFSHTTKTRISHRKYTHGWCMEYRDLCGTVRQVYGFSSSVEMAKKNAYATCRPKKLKHRPPDMSAQMYFDYQRFCVRFEKTHSFQIVELERED